MNANPITQGLSRVQRNPCIRGVAKGCLVLFLLAPPDRGVAQEPRATVDLSIGVVDGPMQYTLAEPVGVVVAANGSMWVLDRGDARVMVYDRNGRFLRSIGGSGRGPGEFMAPTEIASRNDTVAVYDPPLRRLTFLGPEGELLATERVEA
ncbi:MAG: 6-bladed beta-propeller, partial [Gemmatimonadetes bacterium]|nr:6-bladed beta-propeller [Gemmatimonadota bacterium]